jgi:hypothetical protein
MKTGIFQTSRAARDAWLAERPDLERRYRPANRSVRPGVTQNILRPRVMQNFD